MKRIILLVAIIFTQIWVHAQPNLFNYQAIARNASGTPFASRAITLRISILDSIISGPNVYSETHSVTTNAFGLFNVAVGGGTPVSGNMDSVKWGKNDKFIKVEIDTSGGTSYVTVSTSQLLSVPYALYAKRSEGSGIHITAFQPNLCTVRRDTIDVAWRKIKDVGAFTTYNTGSKVEIRLQTTMYWSSGIGSPFIFEIRVDDAETTVGVAGMQGMNKLDQIIINGIFSGLSVGTHTLSIWVRSVNTGPFDGLYLDYDCVGSKGANSVIIKEYP